MSILYINNNFCWKRSIARFSEEADVLLQRVYCACPAHEFRFRTYEVRRRNSTSAEEVSRFQRLFPNSSWLTPARTSGHQLECSTTPSSFVLSFFSSLFSALTIFFSISQAAKNSPFPSFLSSLAYLSTGLTPWNFDPTC